ncbi:MAG: hypothetical protein EOP94_04195, partial [Zymomonas sp.]
MRHIVLFEPDASGHRMVFVRYIVEAMARHGGVRATLVTTERGKTGFERLTIDDRAHRLVTMHVIGEPDAGGKRLPLPRKLSMQAEQTRLLRAALQSLGSDAAVDHVLIPFIDDYCLLPALWRTATFGTIPFSGIAIRPRFHLKKSGADVPNRPADWVERLAYRRLLSAPSFKTLFSIDPYLEQRLDTPRVVTVCDPADIAGNIADPAWLPVAEEAVVLLVYGYIDSRKAIDRLLRLVADPAMPKSLVVALVGEQDRQLRPVMESALAVSLRAEHRLVEVNR